MAPARPTISTHVLDLVSGDPAAGVAVTLFRLDASGAPQLLSELTTDADGRIRDLLQGATLTAGEYQLAFDVGGYADEEEDFFQSIALALHVVDVQRSYHVPLLLSPFGMTTYRGS
jgi:5-hydroxyisourate hydrolase